MVEVFEPEASDFFRGFGHQSSALPLARDPEAAVDGAGEDEADGADDLCFGIVFEAKHPVPLVSAFDGGEGVVAIVGFGSVFREGPWDAGVELFDDLPLGEERLDVGGVGECEWAQD